MNIGLIDVDGHNFPNFALMRASAYHKTKGDQVEWATFQQIRQGDGKQSVYFHSGFQLSDIAG